MLSENGTIGDLMQDYNNKQVKVKDKYKTSNLPPSFNNLTFKCNFFQRAKIT